MTNSKISTPLSVYNSEDLFVPTIKARKDDYMMITKRELELIGNYNFIMTIGSELSIILGSTVLGYSLNLLPFTKSITEITFDNLFILFLGIFLLCYGFWQKYQHKIDMKKTLKLYEDE